MQGVSAKMPAALNDVAAAAWGGLTRMFSGTPSNVTQSIEDTPQALVQQSLPRAEDKTMY